MGTMRQRRVVAVVVLLLLVVLALGTGHGGVHAAMPWALVPVFLFGLVEGLRLVELAAGEVEGRLPIGPARPSLFERPPPAIV